MQRFLSYIYTLIISGNFWNLICVGGLIERGAYSEFWLQGEGLIREGGLIELLRCVKRHCTPFEGLVIPEYMSSVIQLAWSIIFVIFHGLTRSLYSNFTRNFVKINASFPDIVTLQQWLKHFSARAVILREWNGLLESSLKEQWKVYFIICPVQNVAGQ